MITFSEEEGFVLVDISGLPNENNIDPHPLASGQAYIANQILDTKAVFVKTVPDEADAPAGDPTPDEPDVPAEDPMPGQPVNPGLCRLAALFNKLVKFRAVVLDLRQLLKAGAHSARNDGCWAGWLQSRTGWRPASVCA